jgi:hypothetical protein
MLNYQATLEGTGVLPNSSTCYVYAENFKLLPHSVGMTTIDFTKSHIVLPNIKGILYQSEECMLQINATTPINLQRIEDIIERATSREHVRGIDLDRVTSTLQNTEVYDRSSYIFWMFYVILIWAGLGILWFVWTNANKPYFCHWKRIHPPTSVDIEFDERGYQKEILELP